jgi:hypothetical protein
MSRGLRNRDFQSPVPRREYVERIFSPPYEIQYRGNMDHKKKGREQKDRIDNSVFSLLICEMITNEVVNEAADYSEFMQSVIRQEPDYVVGHLLGFAAAYLEIVRIPNLTLFRSLTMTPFSMMTRTPLIEKTKTLSLKSQTPQL